MLPPFTHQRFGSAWRAYRANNRGAAGVEFALLLTFMVLPLLNATDFGFYVYQRMELQNASQAAAQAAWTACNTAAKLPATVNCGIFLTNAVNLAARGTTLSTQVSVTSTTENYYCIVGSALVVAGPVTSAKPANCSVGGIGGSATDTPGDYILIATSYTYSPLFAAVSIVSLLPTPITQTAWMRLS